MNWLAKVGLVIIVVLFAAAIFAPRLTTESITEQQLSRRLEKPSVERPLGRDHFGRDMYSRLLFGARVSMRVGVTVVLICAVIGTIVGAISGFYGGWVDRIVSALIFNTFLAFPGYLLAIAMVAFLGPSLNNVILALCVIGWVSYARVIRGQVLKVKESDYITAVRALGSTDARILFRHILPNAIQPLIVQATLGMAGAVLAEASLSFLGLGVQEPFPSWGKMLDDGRAFLTLAPHMVYIPGVAIMITVMAFTFVGDGLRQRLDPRQKRV